MTRDEFILKYRGRMLLFLTEAWSVRKHSPSELGMILDAHSVGLRSLMLEMYDALVPPSKPAANGAALPRKEVPK